MSEATEAPQRSRNGGEEAEDPAAVRARAADAAGRAAVAKAAAGEEELSREEERNALDWLLGAPQAGQHTVPVTFDTPEGPATLKWRIRAMDGRKLDSIEQRNRSEVTGIMDQATADCEILAIATVYIADESGKRVTIDSPEFLTLTGRNRETGETETITLASPAEALERRFRFQGGLLMGVAREVRRISGFDPTLVGKAQRSLVDASGN